MPTLHVTNGDSAAGTLRDVVQDPVLVMADVLHEGRCPPLDGDAWHDVRARFLASGFGVPFEATKASLAAADAALAAALARNDGIVLWFEHDLFDQLLLIRVLDLMTRLKPDTTSSRVSLICIGAFPGVDRFIGLGQLTAAQLGTLRGTGRTVTRGHFRLAAESWHAFRSPDPRNLLQLAYELVAARQPSSEGGPALPFLGAALLRLLAEYPSTANGLSQTEGLALERLSAGACEAGVLFRETQAREAAPFLGDLTFFDVLQRLASAKVPLISLQAAAGADPGRQNAAITHSGREVLAGRADHVSLNGIDVWRGGVHLAGSDNSPWRWDERDETLVS